MAYGELIKDFARIRNYMRQFFVYGFKRRDEYDAKSPRSYDNERRRMESWLGDFMSFRQDRFGKYVFLSVDSRTIPHNPLYRAFKAKSFTGNDITLHFFLLDLLANGQALPVREIVERMASDYYAAFDSGAAPDESTVRNKLKEYEALGLLICEKHGRSLLYRRAADAVDLRTWREAVAFFSEADPMGVIGSYVLDRIAEIPGQFRFKHHYFLRVLDGEVLCALLLCMAEKRCADLSVQHPWNDAARVFRVYPLKIYVGTQTGRQYVLGYCYRLRKPMFFRLDGVRSVKPGPVEKAWAKYMGYYDAFRQNLWGVSTGAEFSLEHLEMTIRVEAGEEYILRRLVREKRCGHVEAVAPNAYRFVADVYDAMEMLPWIRTFIGRITALTCSNRAVVDTFDADLATLRGMYGGEDHVQ